MKKKKIKDSMKYNKIVATPFSAQIILGLEKGYTQEPIHKDSVITFLQAYQQMLLSRKDIVISASVSDCEIVCNGQLEPHLKINFINYPKFQLEKKLLKETVEDLTKALMKEFSQNRVVIEYLDETVMLEVSDEIDTRILN